MTGSSLNYIYIDKIWKNRQLKHLRALQGGIGLNWQWFTSKPVVSTNKLFPKTLNLLRKPITNTQLSSEAHLNVQFDFNWTPLSPPGINTILHKNNGLWSSWSPNGAKMWYIGESPYHCHCWKIYVTETCTEHIGETLYVSKIILLLSTLTCGGSVQILMACHLLIFQNTKVVNNYFLRG